MTHDENTAMERSYHPTGAELWFLLSLLDDRPAPLFWPMGEPAENWPLVAVRLLDAGLAVRGENGLTPAAPLAPLLDTVKSADRAALVFLRTPGGAVDAVLYYNRVGGVLLRRESAARYTLQALDIAALLAALPPLNGAGEGTLYPEFIPPAGCRRHPLPGGRRHRRAGGAVRPRLHAAGPLAMAGHRLRLQGTPPDARQRDHRPRRSGHPRLAGCRPDRGGRAMLNVEIRLPGTGQHYDFALDETAPVAAVTRAVAEAICAETHAPAPGDAPLSLYDPARAARLDPCGTLPENGVGEGAVLILL